MKKARWILMVCTAAAVALTDTAAFADDNSWTVYKDGNLEEDTASGKAYEITEDGEYAFSGEWEGEESAIKVGSNLNNVRIVLDGADINAVGKHGISAESDVTIVLKDGTQNTIISSKKDGIEDTGIRVLGTLSIDGRGSLRADGASFGILSDGIKILGGTVTADGVYGGLISSSNDITIGKGVTVTASGGDSENGAGGDGISSAGDIEILGGTVTASGGNSEYMDGGDGISSEGDIKILGGTVTASGGDSENRDGGHGIYSAGDIEILDLAVTASGGAGGNQTGYGIKNENGVENIKIRNSDITITDTSSLDGADIKDSTINGKKIGTNKERRSGSSYSLEEGKAKNKKQEEEPDESRNKAVSDTEGHWAEKYINSAVEKGYMDMISEGIFLPDNLATRLTIVEALYKMAGSPEMGGLPVFSDTDSQSVVWAAQNGIISGFEDSTFRPYEPVSREQLSVIIYNYAKYLGKDVSNIEGMAIYEFKDYENISGWALTSVRYCMNAGILNGNADGSYNPKGGTTRAELAKILADMQ